MKKKTQSPCILVLGATGMLGRVVYTCLKKHWPDTVWGTSRQKDEFLSFDIDQVDESLQSITTQIGHIDYVVNCIGLLRSYHAPGTEPTVADYIRVNSLLPQLLDLYCQQHNSYLLHMSTDAVFADSALLVTELSTPSPQGTYALSKALGEPTSIHSLNLRASIIGCDPREGKGLIEMVRRTTDVISGFSNSIFCGATVLQVAHFYEDLIAQGRFCTLRQETSVLHFIALPILNRFDLLCEIANVFSSGKTVVRSTAPTAVTRELHTLYAKGMRLDHYQSSLMKALQDLYE